MEIVFIRHGESTANQRGIIQGQGDYPLSQRGKEQARLTARALESLLTELGIPHTWHLYPGTHDEAYWHDHVPAYLLWYASHWMGD